MELKLNDICIMKKNHPCGGNRFVLLRVGMDVKIKCLNCGREVWMLRSDFERGLRKTAPPED